MDLGKGLGRNSSVKGDIGGPEYLGNAFGPESNPGFAGARISLNDAFYDPWYSDGENNAIFSLAVQPDGTIDGGARFELGQWHTLTLAWSLEDGSCEVSVDDGKPRTSLALKRKPYRGTPICYLRLKSGAAETSSDLCGDF